MGITRFLRNSGSSFEKPILELGQIQSEKLVFPESCINAFAGASTSLKFRLTALIKAAEAEMKDNPDYRLTAALDPAAKRRKVLALENVTSTQQRLNPFLVFFPDRDIYPLQAMQ